MAVRAEKRYRGRIVEGALIQSAAKSTPGFQIILDCEDGTIDHTIWLTEKNRDKAERDFSTIGVSREQLGSRTFLAYELPQVVQGVEVDFGTKMETYKDQDRVKVAWIGKPKAETSEDLAASVAALFGAQIGAPPLDAGEPPHMDDDAPPF